MRERLQGLLILLGIIGVMAVVQLLNNSGGLGLSSFGILKGESGISATTWSLIEEMGFSKDFLDEWKNAAANPPKK